MILPRGALLCLFACVSFAASPCFASANDAFLAIDAAWNNLRLRGDAAALAPLLADDWMLTHSDGRLQYKADYLSELGTRARTNQGIGNEDVKVRLYDGTAIVTGTSVQAGVTDGKPWSGRFRFTRVWVHRDGTWLMVSSHSSRIASP